MTAPISPSVKQTMRDTFGISRLRPGQQEVIDNVLQGHDTLAIMPTGSGKSLCYQLPALKKPGITLVVSPLISLMKDQVGKLEQVGIDATQINSSLSAQKHDEAIQDIRSAASEFVFATPERLCDPDFLALLRRHKIDLFVIDEAHCISQWGHDFRPAYLELSAAIEALGSPPVLALTATATERVIEDIIRQLKRPNMQIFNTGVYRENLYYGVVQATSEEEKTSQVLQLIRQHAGSGIIYAATIKAVEQLHQTLRSQGESATVYHGQLNRKQRQNNQEQFMAGSCRLMIATNAFGMGIDKPDIRFILHFHLPANLGAYYQESGRAGRDGKPASCILIYWWQDKRIQQFFLARTYPSAEEIRAAHQGLQSAGAEHAHVTYEQLQHAATHSPASKLRVALRLLADAGIAEVDEHLRYRLVKKNVKNRDIAQLADTYRNKGEYDREALEQMVFYAQTGFCRWKVLLEHFGEDAERAHCGHCDNCLHPPEQHLTGPAIRDHTSPEMPVAGPKIPIQLLPGNMVQVPKYGQGQVVMVSGEKVTVIFSDRVKRIFLRDYLKLASPK